MSKEQSRLVNTSIIFIGAVLFVMMLKTFQFFLRPLVIAFILTILLMPFIRYCSTKKIPMWLSTSTIVLGLIVIIFLFGTLIKIQAGEINKIIPEKRIGETVDVFSQILSKINLIKENLKIEEIVRKDKLIENSTSIIKAFISSTTSVISESFITLIFIIFMIPSYQQILKKLKNGLKKSKVKNLTKAVFQIEESIKNYLFTKTVISLGTGLVSMMFLILFNAKLALTFGVLIFLFNYIPNIGSIIAVAITGIAYFMIYGFGWNLVWLLICLIGTQILFGNFIEPKWVGEKLKISPILIILSLFFWGWVWGIPGMFLAVPLTSIIKIILKNVKTTEHLAQYMY